MTQSHQAIKAILLEAGLEADPTTLARLIDDLDIARDAFRSSRDEQAASLTKREGKVLSTATQRILTLARARNLTTEKELEVVHRLNRYAEVASAMNRKPGSKIEAWIWPCCLNFLDTWYEQKGYPPGMAPGEWRPSGRPTLVRIQGVPTRGLDFLLSCCQQIEPAMTADRIITAADDYYSQPEWS